MPSLRKAINDHCKDCVAADGCHYRKEVLHCQGYSCKLYGVRPIPKDAKVDSNMRPIKDMSDLIGNPQK